MITKLITILQELDLGDNDFYKFIPEHTKIISDDLIVDAACMNLVINPQKYVASIKMIRKKLVLEFLDQKIIILQV